MSARIVAGLLPSEPHLLAALTCIAELEGRGVADLLEMLDVRLYCAGRLDRSPVSHVDMLFDAAGRFVAAYREGS